VKNCGSRKSVFDFGNEVVGVFFLLFFTDAEDSQEFFAAQGLFDGHVPEGFIAENNIQNFGGVTCLSADR